MNFSKKRPVKIVMLGAGGTGAHIAPHLYRLLYALERPVKFIICDGDKVEPKNLVRQNFTEADLGENKARVIAERYSDVFGLETSYIPRFIEDAGQLEELLAQALERVRHCAPGATAETKALLHRVGKEPMSGLLDSAAEKFAQAVRGTEGNEGTMAFMQKRPPKWAEND